MSNNDEASSSPIHLLIDAGTRSSETINEQPIVSETLFFDLKNSFSNIFQSIFANSTTSLPQLRVYTKQEQYEDLRAYLKQAWREFNRRPIPTLY